MRFDCREPGFEGVFVEFTDSWSRKEVRDSWAATPAELFPIIQRKIITIYLPTVNGDPIVSADGIVEDRIDDVDTRLYTWFLSSWVKQMNELSDLGNALGRQLFVTSDTSTPTKKTTKTKTAARSLPRN